MYQKKISNCIAVTVFLNVYFSQTGLKFKWFPKKQFVIKEEGIRSVLVVLDHTINSLFNKHATIFDTVLAWKAHFYQQFHPFTIQFCLNIIIPHPQINVTCSWRKTWGSKVQPGLGSWYNIHLGGWGGGTQGEGCDYFMQKGVIQWTYLNTFVPYCRFLKNWSTYLFKRWSLSYHFEMSDPSVWPFDNNSVPTLHGGKMRFLNLYILFQIDYVSH